MVVDDDRMIREMTVTALSYCVNREVMSFDSGLAAWDYIGRGGLTDLVITDVDMPELNGLELLERIREDTLPIRVVIMSGVAENESRARRHGADAFLAKPFEVKDLFRIVQTFVIEADSETHCWSPPA